MGLFALRFIYLQRYAARVFTNAAIFGIIKGRSFYKGVAIMVFSCKSVQKAFGVEDVLTDVSFTIQDGEKAALVGVNGAGKTTLFRIITGELPADAGELSFRKNARVGYLSQMTELDAENTIEQEFMSVFAALTALERELRAAEHEMSGLAGDALAEAMARYARLNDSFEEQKGYETKSRVRGVMKGLGFDDAEFELPTKHLSGGQKTRVSLGKLLLTAPDLLLLDEPTNHLDLDSVAWLEDQFLKNYPGAVLVISHDRYFLDKTVTKIIEIENGRSVSYEGNYTLFAYKKEIDREIKLKHFMDQQKEIKRQQEVIQKLRSFNREKSIKRAESREKMLAKLERAERPADLPDKMRIVLEPSKLSGTDVLFGENVSKAFDDEVLFENASFGIRRGEIIALVGPNGVGKTTLFKMILNQSCEQGKIKLGSNVEIGYYDQEYATLDEEKTIFEEISDAYPAMKNVEIRNILAAFMFTNDDVFKTVKMLSGGERGRVALAKLMLGNVNFLMLDEPTNHLDMFSKEILEEALRNYTGTVLYISHDRYFINNTAEAIWELTPGGINAYLGNYDYYMEKRETAQAEAQEQERASAAKEDWRRKKEEQAEERRRQARVDKLEKEIAHMEEEIKKVDEKMTREEVYANPTEAQKAYQEKKDLEENLQTLYEEWEDVIKLS